MASLFLLLLLSSVSHTRLSFLLLLLRLKWTERAKTALRSCSRRGFILTSLYFHSFFSFFLVGAALGREGGGKKVANGFPKMYS